MVCYLPGVRRKLTEINQMNKVKDSGIKLIASGTFLRRKEFSLCKGTRYRKQIYKLQWNEPVFVNGSFQSSSDCDRGPTWLSSSGTLI